MTHKLSKIEIVLTAIIFIVACFGIGVTIYKRVDKSSGKLTMENYTDYMRVNCSLGSGGGGGGTIWCKYYITIAAEPYYTLENVTISYSLESNGANLPDDTLTATVEAGKSYTKQCEDKFTVTMSDDAFGKWNTPTLKITVKSVTGTYRYKL